jgi:glycosyltransferase involved in cell wall biosynthesis
MKIMSKAKILFVDSNCSIKGGGQISLLELIRTINRNEFDLVAISGENGELSINLSASGLPVEQISFPGLRTLDIAAIVRCILRILAIVRKRRVDIIHSNDTRAHFYCGIAANLAGIPCIFHYRVSYTDGIWDRLLPIFAARIIAVSKSVAKRFPQLSRRKLLVVYNAVDVKKFKRVHPTLRKDLSIHHTTYVLGTVGRLSPEKGIDAFLKIVCQLALSGLDCHAIIAGKGDEEYRKHLFDLCSKLKITDRVHFIDVLKDVPQYYSSLDTYCLFSANEGFSRSIIEAMAVGCPVVAADVGGNHEAVFNGETGYLITPGDQDLAVAKLNKLAKDIELRKKMGERAREMAAEHFQLEKQAEKMESIYKTLQNEI